MQSAIRLTCFALISAIETDLRQLIQLASQNSSVVISLPDDVRKNAFQRWSFDHNSINELLNNDIELLEYTDFAELSKILNVNNELLNTYLTDLSDLSNKLILLSPARNRVCHSRPLEGNDFADLFDFASFIKSGVSNFNWPELTQTIARLEKEPTYVLHLVIPSFWSLESTQVMNNLPLPDFDETGFMGRISDRQEINRLITSSTIPLITITGEGGVGKTALALRCLYDLLTVNTSFDAIVWYSLKLKALSVKGIEDIRDSMKSTFSLVQTLSKDIIGTHEEHTFDEYMDEIIEYMRNFNILLAIDNYESINDHSLRKLFTSIPNGSKIILTSRFGYGELELRYKLDQLDSKTAIDLMRRFARTLNVLELTKSSSKTIGDYCNKLFYNPLLIKWFVRGVSLGHDPNSITQRKGDNFVTALKFCFENLYDKLSESEKNLLHVLASARKPLTQTELYYLSSQLFKKEKDTVDWALINLHSSSMLKRTIDNTKTSGESSNKYALTDIALEYISSVSPPNPTIYNNVQAEMKKIREMTELNLKYSSSYKYDTRAIIADTTDQKICASYLYHALKFQVKNQSEEARNKIKEAKELLPHYSETYRISGFIEADCRNYYKATEEYEIAISLSPKSTICLYVYGLYLQKHLEDNTQAIVQFEKALKIDPNDSVLLSAYALSLTRVGKYQDAIKIYNELLKEIDNDDRRRWAIPIRDQAAECYRRMSELALGNQQYADFEINIDHSLTILEDGIRTNHFDPMMRLRFAKVIQDALYYGMKSQSSTFVKSILFRVVKDRHRYNNIALTRIHRSDLLDVFKNDELICKSIELLTSKNVLLWSNEKLPLKTRGDHNNEKLTESNTGIIKQLNPGTYYGFIEDEKGERWFFHKNHLKIQEQWIAIKTGSTVSFNKGKNQNGECAINVFLKN